MCPATDHAHRSSFADNGHLPSRANANTRTLMARGMYRWWEGEGPSEVWLARVELEPGVWEDVRLPEYEAGATQPPFWDLPLKEEYFERLLGGDAAPVGDAQSRIMRPVIILLIIIGSVLFVVVALVVALMGQFSH